MASKKPVSRQARIAKPSPAWEKTKVARLYKRVDKQRISWIYKHVDGRSQTLASSVLGDRAARNDAERLATKLAIEIQQGAVVAGADSEMIERFELKDVLSRSVEGREDDPKGHVHQPDQVLWQDGAVPTDGQAWLSVA